MPYNRWIAIPFILDVGRLRGDILHLIRLHFTTCHIECYGQNIENYENHSEHSNLNFICKTQYSMKVKAPLWSNGSVLDHRSLSLVFESGRVHIWRVFHLWLRFITFGGHSAHLTYHVDKGGRKTSIIIAYRTITWLVTCLYADRSVHIKNNGPPPKLLCAL